MECGKWSEEDWQTLLYTITQGNCILMLGPDASGEQVNGQWQSFTEQLAQELFETLDAGLQTHLDSGNLAQMAQYYFIQKKRHALNAKVHLFYESKQQSSNELYTELAALPFHLTLTSTPDSSFLQALKQAGKNPEVDRYNFRGKNREMVHTGTVESPLLFHLYGFIREPESLVLTEIDLIDFLAAVIAKNPPLPHNILSQLRDPNNSLLFLGFGFKHWYLRILLHVLQGRNKESGSFALEQCLPQNVAEFQQTILFFSKSRYNIQICTKNLLPFVRELRQRYEDNGAHQHASLAFQAGPGILICYVPTNDVQAKQLAEQLQAQGYRIRQNDQAFTDADLQQLLQHEADYVVVLQSEAFVRQFEGSFEEKRVRQERVELQNLWESCHQKLSKLRQSYVYETDPAKKMQLQRQVQEAETEVHTIEAQLEDLDAANSLTEPQNVYQRVIMLALKRQQHMQPGTSFIIPLKLDDCTTIREFQGLPLPPIEYQDNADPAALFRALKRDQERRKRWIK